MSDSYATDLDAYRAGFRQWLDEHEPDLERQRGVHSHEFIEVTSRQRELQAALFEAGWVRYGWAEALGGLGGDARHRAEHVRRAGGARRARCPEPYYTIETLIPML